MHVSVSSKIIENEKLYNHLKEHSYWLKDLNRDPLMFKDFIQKMKEVYKERTSDRISSAIDNVELVSSILESIR